MAAPTDLAYAVHTATCTYLLDDEGVCRWIVSPRGTVPKHVQMAIGAQFVACLDLEVEGGLVGELAVGAMALLVRHDDERMVLLRTAAIEHVDDRRARASVPEPTTRKVPKVHKAAPPQPRAYGKSGGVPYMAAPPPRLSVVDRRGSETTITVRVPKPSETTARTPRRR